MVVTILSEPNSVGGGGDGSGCDLHRRVTGSGEFVVCGKEEPHD